MQLDTQVAPIYFPEAGQSSVLRLGLQPLAMQDWIAVDNDLPLFHRHKLEQKRLHFEEVYQELPESLPAQKEFCELLLQHLLNHHAGAYSVREGMLIHTASQLNWEASTSSLWQASIWIQEDICILESADRQYRLAAASVCSPSNWSLKDKIGRSIDVIHGPVPGYQDQLSNRVVRLLDGIKPGKPVRRFNWSIQHGHELFWRADANAGNKLDAKYWRVERQTLLRLPETNAIVFGIRIFLHSFEIMRQHAEFNNNINAIIDRLPTDQIKYKGLQ